MLRKTVILFLTETAWLPVCILGSTFTLREYFDKEIYNYGGKKCISIYVTTIPTKKITLLNNDWDYTMVPP